MNPYTPHHICLDRVGGADFKIGFEQSREALHESNHTNSKSSLRQDLLFLDTTDRVPVRREVVVPIRAATVKVEAVGVVGERSGRPVAAAAASIVGTAVIAVAVAGSREKYLSNIF